MGGTILTACVNQTQKKDYSLLGEVVSFPEAVSDFDSIDSIINSNNLHIIIYIDSSQCTPCAIDDIVLWEKYDDFLCDERLDITLIFGINNQQFISNLLSKDYINYPYIIDKKRALIKNNPFLLKEKFRTFIIDRKKTIIWLGTPLLSQKSWNLFTNLIKSYKNENQKDY